MKYLGSLGSGLVLAFTGIALHGVKIGNFPLGLILALAATFLGMRLIRQRWNSRRTSLVAAVAWVALVARAGTFSAGREILIVGSSIGSAFIVLGLAVLIAGLLIPSK
jgi:predicted membrane-bound spermidine synthase